MSVSRASVAAAYVNVRLAQACLRTRHDIAQRQERLWRRQERAIAKTPALAAWAGEPLRAFPVIEPPVMRDHPEQWNSLGLGAAALHAAALASESGSGGEVCAGVFAGFSTGSEGARGIFLTSASERARYIALHLAKLLPGDILRRRRIGLCLRANNALYRDVANAGPFSFSYVPLSAPALERARAIESTAPDIFIAPSHVLADLARLTMRGQFTPPKFERVFHGAEPMGALERRWIGETLGVRPDPIYQATEGFLGAACEHGTLHLNEESVVVELEPVAGSNRYRPIITDLHRTSQPMVRVRLDDLIELSSAPCPCGSPLRAIEPVEGRTTDIWRWGQSLVLPRQIENALAAALGPSIDWRATASPAGVRIAVDPDHEAEARQALETLMESAQVTRAITACTLAPESGPKRRRVRWLDA